MPRYLVSFVAVIVTALVALGASSLAAQEGTPEVSSRVAAPAECEVEPRSASEVAEIVSAPGDALAEDDSDATPTPLPVPLGERADPETRAEIEAVARELLACFNAGDVLSATALMTEAGIVSFFGVSPDDTIDIDAVEAGLAATPTPLLREDWSRLIAVTDISVLEDDRVAAFIVFNDPLNLPRGPATLLVILEQVDGDWLIDDFISLTTPRQGTPVAATPTTDAAATPAP